MLVSAARTLSRLALLPSAAVPRRKFSDWSDSRTFFDDMSFCSWTKGEKYKDHFEHGIYVCSKCDNPIFKSAAKYKHSTPWPAFTEPISKDSLKKHHETETALKVKCAKCQQGLGHQFLLDGPTVGSSRF